MCSVYSCQDRGGVGGSQSQVEVLKETLQTFSVPDQLNWLGKGDKVEVLENSWTAIVHSHKVHYPDQGTLSRFWDLMTSSQLREIE